MHYRNLLPLACFLVLLTFLWKGLFLPTEAAIPTQLKDKQAPRFALPQLGANDTLVTEKIFNGKITLVNFWASWCTSCRAEHDFLMNLKGREAFQLIGVNYKDPVITAEAWLYKFGNPYRHVIYDGMGSLGIDWGVYGTPETFLLNPDGVIVYRHVGAINEYIWQDIFIPKILAIEQQFS
jgi:cytochrome c biogenesis protein CcmG, thiol:disulfide interchange protein DsbE